MVLAQSRIYASQLRRQQATLRRNRMHAARLARERAWKIDGNHQMGTEKVNASPAKPH